MECDVLIAGGGIAGVSAAVMAARQGVKTVLVEKNGSLGGTAVFSEIGHMMPNHFSSDGKTEHGIPMDGPVYLEIMERMNEYLPPEIRISEFRNWTGRSYMVFKDLISLAMEDLCIKEGVQLLYHFNLADVIREKRCIRYAVFLTRSGYLAIEARNFIDATGNGDLATLSGCTFEMGDPAHGGYCQPMSLCFKLSHVDYSLLNWNEIQRKYRDATASGVLDCKRENILAYEFLEKDVLHFNTTRILKKSAVNAMELSDAEIEGRRQMRLIVNWLKSEFPAFRNARYSSVAPEIGVRESRRILGRAYLTKDDFVNHRKFPDGIARSNYNIDIHSVTGSGTTYVSLPSDEYYEIPFRALLPRDIDNLAVGGRPISVSHEVHASSRIMPSASSTGQAAGVGAAVATKRRIDVSALDGVEVRSELRKMGARI